MALNLSPICSLSSENGSFFPELAAGPAEAPLTAIFGDSLVSVFFRPASGLFCRALIWSSISFLLFSFGCEGRTTSFGGGGGGGPFDAGGGGGGVPLAGGGGGALVGGGGGGGGGALLAGAGGGGGAED